jgi:hypothetical protein
MACLKVAAEGAGALDAGAYLSVNLSPRTLESELFHPSELTRSSSAADHARPARRGADRARGVQDLDGLRKNAGACRRVGIRLAADDVGAGNAGLRLLSEVQFDIVKIDLSLVQGGVLHDPEFAVLRALQELAARWHARSSPRASRPPNSLPRSGASASPPARVLLGRPSRDRACGRSTSSPCCRNGSRREGLVEDEPAA